MYTKKNGRVTFKSNRRSNFKRHNYRCKARNKGNITQQYNKYLKLAKDTFGSGDRIQAEYYYQFTDHYYRLMLDLGINFEEQESLENKFANNDTINLEENSLNSEEVNDKKAEEQNNDEEKDKEADQSIESVPFISEPVKKKRSRSPK